MSKKYPGTITNTSFTNISRQCRTCQKLLENDSDGTSSSFAFVTIDNFWSSSIKGLPWTFQRRSISQQRVCCLKCSARKRWYLSLFPLLVIALSWCWRNEWWRLFLLWLDANICTVKPWMSMIIANECMFVWFSRIRRNFENTHQGSKWNSYPYSILLRKFLKVANFRQAISRV